MDPHEYLNRFTNFESHLHKLSGAEFDLSRVKDLLDLLGRPQDKLKVIHVAGTKGKGSTCAFIAHILAAAGYRTGLYTSPHLHRLNERIRILDPQTPGESGGHAQDFYGAISDGRLAQVLQELRGPVDDLEKKGGFLTYFEVLTAAALVFFTRQKVDFVVLETGLGGRLDATNAADSLVAVITPISMDHAGILGKTLAAIAGEKAGIIKNAKQRVVLAPQAQEAMDVLKQRCGESGVEWTEADTGVVKNLEIALKGEHQRGNAACAVEAVGQLRSLGYKIDNEAVERGLRTTRWPGRFEILRQKPAVIADGAHNAASARALAQTVAQEYPGRRVIMVVGCSADKDVEAIVQELEAAADVLVFAKANHPRAYPFEGALSVPEAVKRALTEAEPCGIVVFTGSMFVAAEARESLRFPAKQEVT